MVPTRRRRLLPLWVHVDRSGCSDSRAAVVSAPALIYSAWRKNPLMIYNKYCQCCLWLSFHMFTPHRETNRTTQTQPNPTSSLTGQHVNEEVYHSSTSGCSSDGGTVWCCSLQQWVRVLNTSISVQLFVAFCVSSFVVLCVADLQVFIIVSHPESKCVTVRELLLRPLDDSTKPDYELAVWNRIK